MKKTTVRDGCVSKWLSYFNYKGTGVKSSWIRGLTAFLLVGATGLVDGRESTPVALENVVVTGTYAPRAAITSDVSILDDEQIDALNKTSVADLLKTLPGLLVEEQGGPGGLTAVSIRGGESNFTLVLVDGVEVNDPTNSRGGSYDFANLNPDMVERIEVVRGAQSSIYGSDALAGVINIITRRPEEGHSQRFHAEMGEDDYSTLAASALGTVGDISYAIEVTDRDDGEPVRNSKRDHHSANLRLRWQPSDLHQLNFAYRYLDGDRENWPEQSGGPRFASVDAQDRSDYTQQIYALSWIYQVTPKWRSALQTSRFDAQDNYSSPGIAPYSEVPPNAADADFIRDKLQWVNTLALLEDVTVSAGADFRHEDGESDGYLDFFGNRIATDFELNRDTWGIFTGVSATPRDSLLLQGSVRYDEPEDFDGETSWQAGAAYSPMNVLTFSANWGQAFKLPSFYALGHGLVGNPALKPEKGESWDARVAWQAVDNLSLEVGWFNNEFKDLVDFDDETFRNVNRSSVQTSGAELQGTWQPVTDLSLRAQATYTDIDVKNEDTKLTGRPRWTASVVGNWQITGAWAAVFEYRYSGEQWAASRYTGNEVTQQLDDYYRLDWVLHWQPTPGWELQLSADNVLDENYETAVGFPAPGRKFRLGVRFIL